MDPGNDCATPRSNGRGSSGGSDGNGGRSANTSLRRRRRLMPSSPTGTQLMPEFNAAGDAGGSGSSSSPSSSRALDLEGVLLLATPVATDSTIIMVSWRVSSSTTTTNQVPPPSPGAPLLSSTTTDWAPPPAPGAPPPSTTTGPATGSPSATSTSCWSPPALRAPVEVGAAAGAVPPMVSFPRGRNIVGCKPQGTTDIMRWDPQAVSQPQGNGKPPNIQMQPQQGLELPYPLNFHLRPGFRIPPNMNFQLPPLTPPAWMVPGLAAGLRVQLGPPVQGPVYLYGSPAASIYPPFEVTTMVPARRSSGLYPPPGVTIRHPPTSNGDPPPLPEQPTRTRVTITAPPASEGPRKPEATPPEQTVQSRVTIRAPSTDEGSSSSPPKQPETHPPQPVPLARVPTFRWPPIAEEDALFTERLHGPSRRPRRLPVFQKICPSDENGNLPNN